MAKKLNWEPLRGGGAIARTKTIAYVVSVERKTKKFYLSYQSPATEWLSQRIKPYKFDSLEEAKQFVRTLV